MDIEMELRDLLRLQDPGERFTDGVMLRLDIVASGGLPSGVARLSHALPRRRCVVLAVAMVAMAAAAAMHALRGPDFAGAPAKSSALPVLHASADRPAAAPDPGNAVPARDPVQSRSTAAPQVAPSGESAVLIVMPASHRNEEPSARAALEAFRSSLLHELGGLRDLVVLDGAAMESPATAPADYRILAISLSDRAPPASSGPGQRISVSIQLVKAPRNGRAFLTFRVDEQGMPVGTECSGGFSIGSAAANRGANEALRILQSARCSAPDIAAALTGFARPPGAGPAQPQLRELIAKLRDVKLPDAERDAAVWQVVSSRAQGGSPALDPEAVDAVADYLAGLPPDARVKWWRIVGAVNDPAVVPPLLEVLRGDPDENVRLEAVALLARTPSAGKEVRGALEQASREDAHYMVRVMAARAVTRHAQWKAQALADLNDTTLSAAERLAAFVDSAPARPSDVQSALEDEEIILPLVQLVRDNRAEPSKLDSSRLLARISESRHPAVIALLAEILLDKSQPASGQMTADAVYGLLSHLGEPGVRDILEQVVASGGDLRTSDRIESELAEADARWPR